MKYTKLRTLLASNGFDWISNTIIAVAVSGYTFDESHASLAEIQLSGATVLSTATVINKSVTEDGWAASQSVTLPVIPTGGPFPLLLMVDTTGKNDGIFPLVAFTGVDGITTATNGDVIVRPENSLIAGTGKWFRF